jgi:uncharacterized protein YegL
MNDYTHITLLVDRSGSMSSRAVEASQAINALVEEQAALPGKLTVSLFQFDDSFDQVCMLAAAEEWVPYELRPAGMTALLDAMAKSIDLTGAALRKLPAAERPSKVIFVVVTDGAENASKHYKRQDVSQRVRTQTDTFSWEFVFIGSNIDAFGEASTLGVSHWYRADDRYVTQTYGGVSASIGAYRGGDNSALTSERLASAVTELIDKEPAQTS